MNGNYTVEFQYGPELQDSHELSFDAKQDAWCYAKAVIAKAAIKGVNLKLKVYRVSWEHEDSEHFYTEVFSRELLCSE